MDKTARCDPVQVPAGLTCKNTFFDIPKQADVEALAQGPATCPPATDGWWPSSSSNGSPLPSDTASVQSPSLYRTGLVLESVESPLQSPDFFDIPFNGRAADMTSGNNAGESSSQVPSRKPNHSYGRLSPAFQPRKTPDPFEDTPSPPSGGKVNGSLQGGFFNNLLSSAVGDTNGVESPLQSPDFFDTPVNGRAVDMTTRRGADESSSQMPSRKSNPASGCSPAASHGGFQPRKTPDPFEDTPSPPSAGSKGLPFGNSPGGRFDRLLASAVSDTGSTPPGVPAAEQEQRDLPKSNWAQPRTSQQLLSTAAPSQRPGASAPVRPQCGFGDAVLPGHPAPGHALAPPFMNFPAGPFAPSSHVPSAMHHMPLTMLPGLPYQQQNLQQADVMPSGMPGMPGIRLNSSNECLSGQLPAQMPQVPPPRKAEQKGTYKPVEQMQKGKHQDQMSPEAPGPVAAGPVPVGPLVPGQVGSAAQSASGEPSSPGQSVSDDVASTSPHKARRRRGSRDSKEPDMSPDDPAGCLPTAAFIDLGVLTPTQA
eukprot:TRINITY_DN5692_c0_g1_i2.p1 TRINITY_DN5692_c0_g1~~TRINITY_DN5692_c0_g1_i2.p1  ORF type:complete len:537 (+),score=90.07 TRINITY_DN5692_c0_g1_i2:55-1665(+)